MSWHCSLALVEEFSARGLLVTASSARLNETRSAARAYYAAKGTSDEVAPSV